MYFIALIAPEDINLYALKWKLWAKERYGCEVALKAPAHITLVAPFWMKQEPEAGLKTDLAKFSAVQSGFPVHLDGFSHFKSRTIFINVAGNDRLNKLQADLSRFLFETGIYPIKMDQGPFSPHITIATRDLPKGVFNEAWGYFKAKKYEKEWVTGGISLLRHNKKNWDVIVTSQFQ